MDQDKILLTLRTTSRECLKIKEKINKIYDGYFYKLSDVDREHLLKTKKKILSKTLNHDYLISNISKILVTPYYGYDYPSTPNNCHKKLLELITKDIIWANQELRHFENLLNITDSFYNIPILVIPAEVHWNNFLNKDRSGCSGITSCDNCLKEMYAHRTGYLKSWITVYLKNEKEINQGKVIIPKLYWRAADWAKEFNICDYHKDHCKSGISISGCNCNIARLLRAMYYATEETCVESLDQIIPLYSNMKFNYSK